MQPSGRTEFLEVPFDTATVEETLTSLRDRGGEEAFRYVVTPNVDHVARLMRSPELAPVYRSAFMSWCDSQPLRRLARLRGLDLPLLTGSDMTARIFSEVVQPGDRIACITADDELLCAVQLKYPECEILGYSPPANLDHNPAAFASCVDFIVETSARFTFIGVGSPRSERLAYAVLSTGRATGTGYCVGAALEFLTDRKARAPQAFRKHGLEWLHRLLTEPKRLWKRYLYAALPLPWLLARDIIRHGRT